MADLGTTYDRMAGEVAGSRGSLFSLVLRTTGLSVITLGIYSFWARTRVRRWLWSSLRVGGTPMEYVGQPLEKLMGFVFAAVMVAVYLGLVVMVLIFLSLNIWKDAGPGIIASFALLAPVYWFAQYRGMRYLLNHTRWRGIGFSMVPGAWGYAWRAIYWLVLAVLTLGLLWPVRAQRLWQYRAERAFYGDDHFRLGIRGRSLIRPFLPFWAAFWVNGAVIALAQGNEGWAAALLLTVPLTLLGWVFWRVRSFGLLTSGLDYAGAAGLTVRPSTAVVVRIHMFGWLLVGIILLVAFLVVVFGAGGAFFSALFDTDSLTMNTPEPYVIALFAVFFYLTFFLGRGALKMVFVTYPLIRHVGQTLTVSGAARINAVRPGSRQHMADADGFANLFDLGSGI